MSHSLYVYYETDASQLHRVPEIVGAIQQTVHHPASLSRRIESSTTRLTWMEIYPAIADDFTERLESAVRLSALPALIQGVRHLEIFEEIALCAS